MTTSFVGGYVPKKGTSERTEILILKVIAAHDLINKDFIGKSDPYVNIDLVTASQGIKVIETLRTKTKRNTLNPLFNEEFILRVCPNDQKLVITIMDEDTATKDDFLGMVEIPLNDDILMEEEETENSSKTTHRYTLKPSGDGKNVNGQIQMSLAYMTTKAANTDNNKSNSQDKGKKTSIEESEFDFDFSSSSSSEEEVTDGQDFDFSSSSSSEDGTALDY